MDALIWNIRSVNTQQAFERLIKMHRKNNYEFIGLMEPMQQSRTLERYRNRIGFSQAISNVSNKIWVFIDEVFEVTVMYNMVRQLTLRLFHTELHVEIVLTLVYAKCDAIERIELWNSLYAMASDMNVPWLVGGDFNVIWDEEEKFGGLPVHINEIDDFRHCINTCNLFDLGFKGSIFTWWNGRAEEDCIFKRLDRCLANSEFQQTFPGIEKVKQALSVWSKSTFGDIFQKIASLEEVVLVHEAEFEANPTKLNRQRLQKVQAELIKF
ncbi:PREDICTED: uncharacterized protein LOC109239885 [Nicotiana attenuata]|uniref:uncharacterized protein LOC109239885 n=1 Tax=Nicotiana attenuata TaxID=49451 RepID=UPI0009049DC5|nr:PREDICTED: uncharacterized protein LOC109239885 [Nicotiana attenuata]